MTYANSADPNQTAPEDSIKHFKKQLHKKQIFGQKSME